MMLNDRLVWNAGDVVITDRDGNPIDMAAFAAEALDEAENEEEVQP